MTLSTINVPITLSGDPRAATYVTAAERTCINSIILLLTFTCLTERLGLSIGKFPLPFCLLVVAPTMGLLILLGFFQIDRRAILIYGGYVVSIMLGTALNGGSSYLKPTSLVLHLALMLMFCVCAPLAPAAQRLFYKRLCFLFVFLGLLSCMQFFGQFALKGTRLFSLEGIVPDSMRLDQHFAFLNPTYYGSPTYRSNGFVFAEPSAAGMFYARGIAIMLAINPSIVGLFVSSVGLLVTYAGTGFLTLLIFLIGYGAALLARPRIHVLLLAIVGGLSILALAIAFSEVAGLNRLIDRMNEFGTTGSSAYARYVGPAMLFWRKLGDSSLLNLLFGVGIGNSDTFRVEGPTPFVPPPVIVVGYESGFVSFCLYVWLLASAFARSFRSTPLRVMFLAQFVLIDPGSNNVIPAVFIAYFVGAAIARTPDQPTYYRKKWS